MSDPCPHCPRRPVPWTWSWARATLSIPEPGQHDGQQAELSAKAGRGPGSCPEACGSGEAGSAGWGSGFTNGQQHTASRSQTPQRGMWSGQAQAQAQAPGHRPQDYIKQGLKLEALLTEVPLLVTWGWRVWGSKLSQRVEGPTLGGFRGPMLGSQFERGQDWAWACDGGIGWGACRPALGWGVQEPSWPVGWGVPCQALGPLWAGKQGGNVPLSPLLSFPCPGYSGGGAQCPSLGAGQALGHMPRGGGGPHREPGWGSLLQEPPAEGRAELAPAAVLPVAPCLLPPVLSQLLPLSASLLLALRRKVDVRCVRTWWAARWVGALYWWGRGCCPMGSQAVSLPVASGSPGCPPPQLPQLLPRPKPVCLGPNLNLKLSLGGSCHHPFHSPSHRLPIHLPANTPSPF